MVLWSVSELEYDDWGSKTASLEFQELPAFTTLLLLQYENDDLMRLNLTPPYIACCKSMIVGRTNAVFGVRNSGGNMLYAINGGADENQYEGPVWNRSKAMSQP